MENSLTPFEGKEIRKVWHNEQWYFSIVDVIEILTDSNNPNRYWTDLKRKIQAESHSYDFIVSMKLAGKDGRKRLTDCANTEGILRIVMSVPSPKAEPLKQWLAQVGMERIQETEQPELAFERMKAMYRAKGYTDEWIKERLKTITTRNELTDEWKNRGVTEGREYSILTAIIAKGTFGLFPSEHKKLKGLTKPIQDLRDNMTDLELIFTALGEATTRRLAIKDDAQGFDENRDKAVIGGKATGEALELYENRTGLKVVSSENFLPPSKGGKTGELPESPTEPKE
jgi:DNA-damage-inducible protein D